MKHLLITFFLLPLFVSGCSVYDASNQSEADQLVSQYHDSLKAEDWSRLLSLYDPGFFKVHSRDSWQQRLTALHARYGALKTVQQTFSQKDSRYRGDYYIYGFKLVFEKGRTSEILTIFKGIESDKLTIAGHVIKFGDAS